MSQQHKPNRPCEQCGTLFYSQPSLRAKGQGRFCSKACVAVATRKTPDDRFWRHVDKGGPVPPHRLELGPCWQWTGCIAGFGYGQFRVDRRTREYAHRKSYRMARGDIPDGMRVLHACDNPACVNPDHLFLGTEQDNMRDRQNKGRTASGDRSGARTKPGRRARGERAGLAKLTEGQVREIRQARDRGETLERLAGRYGVRNQTIHAIVKRHTWNHVA